MSVFSSLKVLELGRVFSGPLCGMLLADLGANVLKIERPGTGDESRGFGAERALGNSCYFNALNRNKKSLALDLKAADDRALFTELLTQADVLVHNWLQEPLDRLGFSYTEVHALNPRLVYCAISGYGHGASLSASPAQDIIAQALSGFMSLTGEPAGPPLRSGIPVVDYATGLYAAFSIMSALCARQVTGAGQFVHVSLLESALAMTSFASSAYLSTGALRPRTGNRHPAICPYNLYNASDGPVVIAVANDEMWHRLCRALDLPALALEARFATNAARLAHQDELEGLLAPIIAARSAARVVEQLTAAKVSCARVNSLAEAFECDPVAELDMVLSFGPNREARCVGKPFHLEDVPDVQPSPPPAIGQESEEIRRRRRW